MDNLTKALLKDLQEDLDRIKLMQSNIEVVWKLETLIQSIEQTNKIIIENIRN